MKNILLSLLLASSPLLSPLASAQATKPATPATPTTPAAPAGPTIKVSNDGHWEYLVISFGKTYYSSPTDIAAKQAGESKLMIFGPLGGVFASEALDVQRQVDTLGRYGWELVTVLGSIGGDQQWVFKRLYDPARAATEAAQIKKEGDELAAARDKAAKDAAAKPVTPPPAPPTELVNLDAQEAAAKQAVTDRALRDEMASRLQLAGWPVAKLETSELSTYISYDGKPRTMGEAVIYLDVTQRALTGNTYRSSMVQTLIEEYLSALKAQGRDVVKSGYSSCLDEGTAFKIGASLKFNNEWKVVSYPSSTYCLK